MADPRVAAEAREQLAAVFAALAELSPSLRITLLLATVEERSYQDIAQALGIPEGTVAWRVNQARKQLRQRLGAALGAADTERTMDEVLRRTKEALGAP
jgi:RNA polymerase sigma-70 factor (ECF subfamily)